MPFLLPPPASWQPGLASASVTTSRPLRSVGEFEDWFAGQQAQGKGYVEVVVVGDSGCPSLTFSFRDGVGVVHWFPSPEQGLLLVGDGTVDEGEAVDLPIQADHCPFTGRFISDVARARRIAADVLRTGATDGLGLWEQL